LRKHRDIGDLSQFSGQRDRPSGPVEVILQNRIGLGNCFRPDFDRIISASDNFARIRRGLRWKRIVRGGAAVSGVRRLAKRAANQQRKRCGTQTRPLGERLSGVRRSCCRWPRVASRSHTAGLPSNVELSPTGTACDRNFASAAFRFARCNAMLENSVC